MEGSLAGSTVEWIRSGALSSPFSLSQAALHGSVPVPLPLPSPSVPEWLGSGVQPRVARWDAAGRGGPDARSLSHVDPWMDSAELGHGRVDPPPPSTSPHGSGRPHSHACLPPPLLVEPARGSPLLLRRMGRIQSRPCVWIPVSVRRSIRLKIIGPDTYPRCIPRISISDTH
jgi:hypothetical protein